MKKNRLKDLLNKKKLSLGSWITMDNEIVAEIMAKLSFDWLVIDLEHSAIDLSQTQKLIRIIELCDVVPLVRVGSNDAVLIKRVMDMGAYGVVVPMVNTKEDAEKAVQAVRYPSAGRRGVGLARAQGYGTTFEEYVTWLKNESVIIAQIEHIDAVENFSEILKTEGIDGFIVGPYDLSGSMGKPGDFSDPAFQQTIKKLLKMSQEANANMGIHVIQPNAHEALSRISEGYRIIALSLDTLFLNVSCKTTLEAVRKKERG